MTDRRAFLLAAAASLAAAWPGVADDAIATDSPAATIASLQQALVAAGSGTVQARYDALEPVIVATHNLPYIAEFALRRQWSSLPESDRQRFIAAFERLSVTTYAARFRNVDSASFRPIEAGAADANGRVPVMTAIRRDGQPDVTFEYLLQQVDANWKIINIVADGVSDLALKRAEYQRLFASGGIDGVIAELEQQTQRMKRD